MDRKAAKKAEKLERKETKAKAKQEKKETKAKAKQEKKQIKSEKKDKVPASMPNLRKYQPAARSPAVRRRGEQSKRGALNPQVNIRNPSKNDERIAMLKMERTLPHEINEVIARHHRRMYNRRRLNEDVRIAGRQGRFDLRAPAGDGDIVDAIFMADAHRLGGDRAHHLRQIRFNRLPGGGY